MPKIVFCGGGTLGHFTPNVAIFNQLKKDFTCYYIGSENGLERKPAENLMKYYSIETVKLVRSLTLKNLLIPFKLAKGVRQAKKILKELSPDIVFSKGGFVSVPVVMASKKLKIPCITHESDYTLGLANKINSKRCKYVCTSFEATSKTLKNGVYTGSPIRREIFYGDKQKIIDELKINTHKKTILVTGGSLGAENLNKKVRESLDSLTNFNIIHLTGKGKIDKSITQNNYSQIEFTSNIQDYFALADLIITRGGSNTIFEILALKKPMLIIPLSTGRGDQILNAKDFLKKGYANVLYEENLTKDSLVDKINETLKNRSEYLATMQKSSKNGTEAICKLIYSLV